MNQETNPNYPVKQRKDLPTIKRANLSIPVTTILFLLTANIL
jgi:hypothetical protein